MKIVEISPTHFLVQSGEFKDKFYTVDLRMNQCSCPNCDYRGVECKHLKGVMNKLKK